MNKKILMLTCPNISIRRKVKFCQLFYGAGDIAGVLKHHGHDVTFYDLNARLNAIRHDEMLTGLDNRLLATMPAVMSVKGGDKIFEEYDCSITNWIIDLTDFIKKDTYDIICMSMDDRYIDNDENTFTSDIFNFSLLLAYKLKSIFPNSLIYIGGECALNSTPKETIIRTLNTTNQPFDAMFMGQGKDTIISYINSTDGKEQDEIRCVYPKKTSKIIFFDTMQRQLEIPQCWNMENTDDTKWDLRTVLNKDILNKYTELNNIEPYRIIPFKFTEGCPFNCSFCGSRNGNFFKLPVNDVVDGLEQIYDNGDSNFMFFNTTINGDKKYMLSICNEIVKRNLKIQYADSGNLKHINDEVCSALVESGCIRIWYGGESGSDKLLKLIRKNITAEQIYASLDLSDKYGIWNAVNVIIAFPNETEKDYGETYKLTRYKHTDCFRANPFNLYPLTEYVINPDKFQINIRHIIQLSNNSREAYAYDDLYLKWEDKEKERDQKMKQIKGGVFQFNMNALKMNDQLLFGISQVIKDKKIKLAIYDDLEKSFATANDLKKYRNKLIY